MRERCRRRGIRTCSSRPATPGSCSCTDIHSPPPTAGWSRWWRRRPQSPPSVSGWPASPRRPSNSNSPTSSGPQCWPPSPTTCARRWPPSRRRCPHCWTRACPGRPTTETELLRTTDGGRRPTRRPAGQPARPVPVADRRAGPGSPGRVHRRGRASRPDRSARGTASGTRSPTTLPLIDTDPGLLERVLANIIGNALKHSPAGRAVRVIAGVVRDDAGRADAGADRRSRPRGGRTGSGADVRPVPTTR